jgi:hypothetical protein
MAVDLGRNHLFEKHQSGCNSRSCHTPARGLFLIRSISASVDGCATTAPDPDTRRPAGADRPRAAPPTHVLVEGSRAGSRRHHPAHPQGRAVIDPAEQIMPAARGSGVMKTARVRHPPARQCNSALLEKRLEGAPELAKHTARRELSHNRALLLYARGQRQRAGR